MEGKTQQTAAAMAGMSERSARKWQCGPLPSETKTERQWRTRPDPFDGVWEREILPLLRGEAAGRLRATTIIEWLEERHPGRFSASQLRTLQRRLQDWRALNGPDQEVYFPQEHPPGREAQIDFTHCNSLGVTVGGRAYRHRLFQLVLSHSGWRYAEVATGETFLALKQGLQNALWELGGAPRVIRSDNTSAATHEMRRSRGRALNGSYAELLDHYGLESTLINAGESHENGVAEQAHYRLKYAIDQALMLRGSRDFNSLEEYAGFVRKVVARRNRLVMGKLEEERPHLRPLPPAPVPEYVNHRARVRKWSTIQAAGRTYTVPSRLIGKEVQIRLYAEHLEVYYKGTFVDRMERVRGEKEARVDYRHVIGSLVRKPGAFARYRFREQMFPTMTFRLAYDALREWRGERADVEYVRILHLAATTMETMVDSALALLLEAGRTLRLRRSQGAGQSRAAAGAGTQPARDAGPEGLRLPAGGGGLMLDTLTTDTLMTDTVAIQERIGELCHQFRLPTMGAQSVSRFTAAGHGDALETLLEVLEQEAEDRRQRRISRLRTRVQAAGGQDLGNLRARPGASVSSDSNWANWPTAASSTAASTSWPSVFPAPGKHTPCAPWATGWWSRAARCSSPRPTGWCRICWQPSGTWPCRDNYGSSTATTSCCWTTWATCPRGPRSRNCSSPSSQNATSAGPWASPPTWSSPSGSTSSPTQWPPRPPSTGWSITRSSWNSTSPATGPEWPSSGGRIRR